MNPSQTIDPPINEGILTAIHYTGSAIPVILGIYKTIISKTNIHYLKSKVLLKNIEELNIDDSEMETEAGIREIVITDNFEKATGIRCKRPMRMALLKLHDKSPDEFDWPTLASLIKFITLDENTNEAIIKIAGFEKFSLGISITIAMTYSVILSYSIYYIPTLYHSSQWDNLYKTEGILILSILALIFSSRYIAKFIRANNLKKQIQKNTISPTKDDPTRKNIFISAHTFATFVTRKLRQCARFIRLKKIT